MNVSASIAARQLADELYSVSEGLASDDLGTIADAMIRVRAAARELARSLEARGWGGGVLYGFGEPGKAESLAETSYEIAEMLESGELEPGWDAEPENPGHYLAEGRRISIQSRLDYIITDETRLRRYVRQRVDAQPYKGEHDDELLLRDPVLMLSIMEGMERNDYSHVGLEMAGFQSIVKPVPKALQEMGWDEVSDAYPTNDS